MKKLETNRQMEQIANKFILILSLLVINCAQKETLLIDDDYKLVKLHLKDEIINFKTDSIFLELDNSNDYILKIHKEYLELKKDSFIKMPKKVSKEINGELKFINIIKGDSIYNNLLNKPWINIKMDSIIHNVYSKNEYTNYEKQLSNKSWDINIFDEIKNIYPSSSKKNSTLHISKPMYTLDKKYALIYNYKIKAGVYPSIKVYENKNNKWHKIYTIQPNSF